MKKWIIPFITTIFLSSFFYSEVSAAVFVSPNPVPSGGTIAIDAPSGASCTVNGQPITLSGNGDALYTVNQQNGSQVTVNCGSDGSASVYVGYIPVPVNPTSRPCTANCGGPTPTPDGDGDGVPDASDLCPNESGTAQTFGCAIVSFAARAFYNCNEIPARLRSRPSTESDFLGQIPSGHTVSIVGEVTLVNAHDGTHHNWFVTSDGSYIASGLLTQDECRLDNESLIISDLVEAHPDCKDEIEALNSEEVIEFFVFGFEDQFCDVIETYQAPTLIMEDDTQTAIHIPCTEEEFYVWNLIYLDILDTLAEIVPGYPDWLQEQYTQLPDHDTRCDFLENMVLDHYIELQDETTYDEDIYSTVITLSCEPTMSARLAVDVARALLTAPTLSITDYSSWLNNEGDDICNEVEGIAQEFIIGNTGVYEPWEVDSILGIVLIDNGDSREIRVITDNQLFPLVVSDTIYAVAVADDGGSIVYVDEGLIHYININEQVIQDGDFENIETSVVGLPDGNFALPEETFRTAWDEDNNSFYLTLYNEDTNLYELYNIPIALSSLHDEPIRIGADDRYATASLSNPEFLSLTSDILMFEVSNENGDFFGRMFVEGFDRYRFARDLSTRLDCLSPTSTGVDILSLHMLCTDDNEVYELYEFLGLDGEDVLVDLNIDGDLNDDLATCDIAADESVSFSYLTRGPIAGSFFLLDSHGFPYLTTIALNDDVVQEGERVERLTSCLPLPGGKSILAVQWAGG